MFPGESSAENNPHCRDRFAVLSSREFDGVVKFPRRFIARRMNNVYQQLEAHFAEMGVEWDRVAPTDWQPMISLERFNQKPPKRVPEILPYRILGARPSNIAPRESTPFWQHPDFPRTLAEARAEGSEVYIDPSTALARPNGHTSSYYRPDGARIVMNYRATMDEFLHELTHHRFERAVLDAFHRSPEHEAAEAQLKKMNFLSAVWNVRAIRQEAFEAFMQRQALTPEQAANLSPLFRRAQEIFGGGVRGEVAINETLATDRAIDFLRESGFTEVNSLALRHEGRYQIYHQLSYLQSLSQPSAQQRELIETLNAEDRRLQNLDPLFRRHRRMRIFIKGALAVLITERAVNYIFLGGENWPDYIQRRRQEPEQSSNARPNSR